MFLKSSRIVSRKDAKGAKDSIFATFAPVRENRFLEIEPRLEFYNTSGQGIARAAEVNVIDVRREEAKRREIQIVKDVEEVCLNFQIRSFAEKCRHARALAETHVNGKVFWTTERIATDAGQQCSVWIVRIEVEQSAAREITARPGERFIVSVGKIAAKVSRRT